MAEGKKTPLYDRHRALGGEMVEFGGWALPVRYTSILAEHKAVREACGLFDVSHMGEITAEGEGALAFLNALCTNSFDGMADGRCRYSPMCYDDGGTVDDLIVYKRGERRYLIIVNAANCEKDEAWMRAHLTPGVTLKNVSDRVAQLALQGPAYREVLAKAGVLGELPVKNYSFCEGVLVAGWPCLVSRTGYTGEPGVEIYCRPDDAALIHEALTEAGAVPCGLGARDTLRFECAMPLYGHELSAEITPLECGLKSFVKLEKESFTGKEALAAKNPPARRRIGLELLDKGVAREHYPVFDAAGREVGFVTSGMPAPTVGKNLAMALVAADAAQEEELFIGVRTRKLRAGRVPLPFYKSENK